MPFDKQKIETKAKENKVDFIIKIALFSIIMFICLLVIVFLFYNPVAVIVGIVSFFWLGYSLGKTWRASEPKLIFSKEYTATVLKIHLNNQKKAPPKNIIAARVQANKQDLSSALRIRIDGGEVILIERMSKEAAESYKVGDTVTHIAGTKYPIVTNRTPAHLPCPICGSLRTRHEPVCRKCGVGK